MEQRGFTCDCGCGQQVVLQPGESLAEKGWWQMFPGRNEGPPLHCSSVECAARVTGRRVQTALRLPS